MISFTEGSPEDLSRLSSLFQAEFDEVGHDGLRLSLNIPLYEMLMRSGRGVLFLAKDDDSVIGYTCHTIGEHPKYKDSGLWGFMAGLYLLPDHRGARTSMRLIQFAEENLRARGVAYILSGARTAHDAVSRLYEALGYAPHEVSFIKKL